MESKYTKEERHQIYKKALQIFLDGEEFMCFALCEALEIPYCEGDYIIPANFPEFVSFKPEDVIVTQCWFDYIQDTKSDSYKEVMNKRKVILEQCIKLTE